MTYGMFLFPPVRTERIITVVESFSRELVVMVLLNDDIMTKLHHSSMASSRNIMKDQSINKQIQGIQAGEEAVKRPVSAYIFTVQSGEQDMGM